MPDGVYRQSSREFVRCENHVASLITCEQGAVFNSRTEQCEDPSDVESIYSVFRDCTTKPDGSYPDYSESCRIYYTCHAGTFFGHTFCTPGTVFNEEIQTCDWPSDVKRPCGTKL